MVQTPGIDDPDVPKIDLLLSGGGLRASAFAYGVLAGLNEICIPIGRTSGRWERREKDSEGNFPDCEKDYSSLLDRVNIISAVSGGAITAAYFKTHREEFFEEFPKLLKKSHLERRLLTTAKPFSLKRILRTPVFLFTSILDMALIPLSLLNLNIEFTPVAVMWLSDGLLESGQLASVYNDLFYENTRLEGLIEKDRFPFEALARTGKTSSSNNKPILLINATDIANGTVFSFDERTFECMGIRSEQANIDLALAVAASSSLPGVFSPVRIDDLLERADPSTIPMECQVVLANRSRKPVLLDGGITDNLGAVGLMRQVIKEKERTRGLTATAIGHDHNSNNVAPDDLRADKHLLFIVNAEAESDSKLPGLAGHFDASYDVLIRSKKDLVRVMASNMLNHFGFGTVELRLSDLVTNEPGIQSIVSGAVERLRQGQIKEAEVARVVPQSMNSTDQEQRVKRDLEQVGMLPTPEEIDTLIAAGRKVVSHRIEDLRSAYQTLLDKRFVSNCSSIANPDRYFCWPDQFRSHDLDSGGGSAFVQSLNEASTEFIRSTTKELDRSMREILLASQEISRQETTKVSNDQKRKNLLAYAKGIWGEKGLVENDAKLHQLYVEAEIQTSIPKDCEQKIDVFKTKLREKISSWSKPEKTLREILHDLTSLLQQHPVTCSPNYHYMRAITLLFDSKLVPSMEELLKIFFDGLVVSDPRLNKAPLQHVLGDYLILYYSNFRQGLDQLEKGINLARDHERNLTLVLSSSKISPKNREEATRQLERMQIFQKLSRLLLASYIATSPLPLPGNPSEVDDDDVIQWERQYLRTSRGTSLVEELLTGKDFGELRGEIERAHDALGNARRKNNHIASIYHNLQKLPTQTTADERQRNLPCNEYTRGIIHTHKANHPFLCQLIENIRAEVRAYLAEAVALREAQEIIYSLYSEYLVISQKLTNGSEKEKTMATEFFHMTGPEILTVYGFVELRRAMSQPCPTRSYTLRTADSLFLRALKEVKDRAQGEEKFGEETSGSYDDPILRRIETYHEFAGELDCAGVINTNR